MWALEPAFFFSGGRCPEPVPTLRDIACGSWRSEISEGGMGEGALECCRGQKLTSRPTSSRARVATLPLNPRARSLIHSHRLGYMHVCVYIYLWFCRYCVRLTFGSRCFVVGFPSGPIATLGAAAWALTTAPITGTSRSNTHGTFYSRASWSSVGGLALDDGSWLAYLRASHY